MNRGMKFALVAVGLGLFGAAASKLEDDDDEPEDDGMTNAKERVYWRLRQVPQLTEDQRLYLMLTAYGEGNYRLTAHNGSASERAASAAAAANNPTIVQRALNCGVPLANLQTGSWTMFQLLAPYVSGTAHEIFGAGFCPFADPLKVTGNLDLQLVIGMEHAHDLQGYAGWKAYRTVGNLRLGWANPGFMGYLSDHADRIERYRDHAAAVGIGRAFIDRTLPVFPDNLAQVYAELQGKPAPSSDPLG
jgi:hypothetical protein